MTLIVYSITVMKNSAKKLTIDEICTIVGMSKRTVRYYIQKGLVDRPEGTGKGAFYNQVHLEQLLTIQKWKIAGLSLDRIRKILLGEKESIASNNPLPPPLPKKQGTVEVWSHMHIGDGIEIHIEPKRAGLTPEQVRALFRGAMNLYKKIKKEET